MFFFSAPNDFPQDFRVVVYGNIPEKVTCSWTGIDENEVRGILMGYNISVTEQNTQGKFFKMLLYLR